MGGYNFQRLEKFNDKKSEHFLKLMQKYLLFRMKVMIQIFNLESLNYNKDSTIRNFLQF